MRSGAGGPGFRRMKKRLGPKKMEEMRQEVLQLQKDARASVLGEVILRDRSTYGYYPPPRRRK